MTRFNAFVCFFHNPSAANSGAANPGVYAFLVGPFPAHACQFQQPFPAWPIPAHLPIQARPISAPIRATWASI